MAQQYRQVGWSNILIILSFFPLPSTFCPIGNEFSYHCSFLTHHRGEHIGDGRIELIPCKFSNFRQRGVQFQSLSIGTVARHGAERIGDSNNPDCMDISSPDRPRGCQRISLHPSCIDLSALFRIISPTPIFLISCMRLAIFNQLASLLDKHRLLFTCSLILLIRSGLLDSRLLFTKTNALQIDRSIRFLYHRDAGPGKTERGVIPRRSRHCNR